MKTYLILLITVLMLASLAYASEEKSQINYVSYLNNLDNIQDLANTNMDKVPVVVKRLLGNEKINIYFITEEKEIIKLNVQLKNGKINTLKKGNVNNPKIDIYLTEKDANDILNSENPKIETKRKIDEKEITYKTYSFLTSLKISILKSFL